MRLEDSHDRPTTAAEEYMLTTTLQKHMLNKLEESRGKLHWLDDRVQHYYLFNRMMEEVEELHAAVQEGMKPREVWREAADVANFAAMIASLYGNRWKGDTE